MLNKKIIEGQGSSNLLTIPANAINKISRRSCLQRFKINNIARSTQSSRYIFLTDRLLHLLNEIY